MAAVTLTGSMPAVLTSPWRVRRSRQPRSPGRGLSPSSQNRAQRQRLRCVGVTDSQLREGAALLAAVQAQLSSDGYNGVGPSRRNGVQAHHRERTDAPWTDSSRHAANRQTGSIPQMDSAQSTGAQTIGSQQAGSQRPAGVQTTGGQRTGQLGTNTGKARSRKPMRAAHVDTGSIRAESWPFFEAPMSSDAVDPRISLQQDDRAVPTVGADGWPTGFGVGPLHSDSTINSSIRRRPTSVSGVRPSSFGGSNFGRPSTSEGAGAARPSARASTSEAATRPSARPSTSEGCRTFGRPPEGRRMRGSSAGRPVTVDGARSHRRTSADGWTGHGDGASWFRAEQEAARREQAAAKEVEERWRAHFDHQSPAPKQDSWERRQARRRAAEERSERRASQFRAQKAREKEVTRQQSTMDDIWSEAESDLQARARRRAAEEAKAAKQKADAEKAVRKVPTTDQAPCGRPERVDVHPPPKEDDLGVDSSDGTGVEPDHTTYDDAELLHAWDAVCGGQRGRDTELDVDQVGELLTQLGKPVGCYELQYIVSKIGDPVTGRSSLTAFRKWWDDVLREFAEWCATQSADPSSTAGQPEDGENYDISGAKKCQTQNSVSNRIPNPISARGSDVSGSNDTGHNCDDGLRSYDESTRDAAAMAAMAQLSHEELAASAKQQVEAARAAAVAQSHAEAEQLRWKRHISEKQRTRVLAHRGQQKAIEEEAAAKRELVSHITDRLARQVRGKSFVAVLQEFGLPIAQGEAIHGAAVHKLYRRALSIYHPDRATRRGLSWQKVAEAEETYKMLQMQYERYVAQQQSKQQQGQQRRQ